MLRNSYILNNAVKVEYSLHKKSYICYYIGHEYIINPKLTIKMKS